MAPHAARSRHRSRFPDGYIENPGLAERPRQRNMPEECCGDMAEHVRGRSPKGVRPTGPEERRAPSGIDPHAVERPYQIRSEHPVSAQPDGSPFSHAERAPVQAIGKRRGSWHPPILPISAASCRTYPQPPTLPLAG
jgi:hypothetical protein